MFDKPASTQSQQPQPSSQMPDVPVYTMPEKFLNPQSNTPSTSSSGGGKKVFLIVIIIVVLLLVGAGVYAYLNFNTLFGSSTTNTNTAGGQLQNSTATLNTNTGTNQALNSADNANLSSNANNADGNTNGLVGFTNSNQNVNNANDNTNFSNANVGSNANASATVSPMPKSKDSDSDGLTDDEELVFQTKTDQADTDADTFFDGAEIASGFDPTKAGGAKLADSSSVATYTNQTNGYSITYPSLWPSRALDAQEKEVLFTSPSGEFIQITIQDNANRLTAGEWYATQSPGIDQTTLASLVVDGRSAVLSPDQLNVYIVDGNRVIVVTYNSGTKSEMSFPTIFSYMYNSMKITATSSTTNTNSQTTNGNANTSVNGNTN